MSMLSSVSDMEGIYSLKHVSGAKSMCRFKKCSSVAVAHVELITFWQVFVWRPILAEIFQGGRVSQSSAPSDSAHDEIVR